MLLGAYKKRMRFIANVRNARIIVHEHFALTSPEASPSRKPAMNKKPIATSDDLDDAIEASFPASDPPCHSVPVAATLTVDVRTTLYRVVCSDAWNGAVPDDPGIYEDRWCSPSKRMISMATCVPMAMLEFLAGTHGRKPGPLILLSVHLCDDGIDDVGAYPEGWDSPLPPESVRAVGDAWMDNSRMKPALRVPSVICAGECNILVDTGHQAWTSAAHEFREFRLDPRFRALQE